MKRSNMLVIILVIILAVLAAACSTSGSQLIGKWTPVFDKADRDLKLDMVIEFTADGTFHIIFDAANNEQEVRRASYTVDGNSLSLEGDIGSGADAFTGTFRIEGDRLILSSSGAEQAYARVE